MTEIVVFRMTSHEKDLVGFKGYSSPTTHLNLTILRDSFSRGFSAVSPTWHATPRAVGSAGVGTRRSRAVR